MKISRTKLTATIDPMYENEYYYLAHTCSNCGCDDIASEDNYCRSCGAKIEKGEDNEIQRTN